MQFICNKYLSKKKLLSSHSRVSAPYETRCETGMFLSMEQNSRAKNMEGSRQENCLVIFAL